MLAIVMPVYNERERVRDAVDRVIECAPPEAPQRGLFQPGGAIERRVFLVDDGSSDGTRAIVEELGREGRVTAVFHPVNQGKGAALRTGINAAMQAGAAIVLIHDADLEYDPADHADVLKPILEGRADAVIGSRFLGSTHRVLYYWHYLANRFITTVCNMFTNLNLSDIECCTKAFTRAVGERLTIEENRFGVEPELIAKLARLRLPDERAAGGPMSSRPARVYEVAVSYAGRTYAEGKKITWKDGVSALRCIVRYALR